MSIKLSSLLLIGVLWRLQTASAQTPPTPCPEYFRYLRSGDRFIGKLILADMPFGPLNVEITFSQREPIQANFGRLSFEHDLLTIQMELETGRPITYRVDFPLANVVPFLDRITVNNMEICTGDEYTESRISYTYRRNFSPSTGSRRKPKQFRIQEAPNNPFFRPPPAPTTKLASDGNDTTPAEMTWSDIDEICGVHSKGVNILIRSGAELKPGQFPWLAAISQKKLGGLQHFAGGTLISSRTVITSAIGLRLNNITADKLVVYLGRNNLDNFNEEGDVTSEIDNVLMHPDFNFPATDYSANVDIALLQLKIAVSFTTNIRPACLWDDDVDPNLIVGETGFIGGWDVYENVLNTPKVVTTVIVAKNDCLQTFEAYKSLTSQRTLCGKNKEESIKCDADTGGSILINRSGRWTLRGLITAKQTTNYKCTNHGHLLYNDVAKHVPWMRNSSLA